MVNKSSRLIYNEMNVSKFNVFTSSIVVIFMVIMSAIYCRLFFEVMSVSSRGRGAGTHGFFVPWNYKFADKVKKKREEKIMLTELMFALFGILSKIQLYIINVPLKCYCYLCIHGGRTLI
jgi:hypothetical protein